VGLRESVEGRKGCESVLNGPIRHMQVIALVEVDETQIDCENSRVLAEPETTGGRSGARQLPSRWAEEITEEPGECRSS
jgi:hypothetical protein